MGTLYDIGSRKPQEHRQESVMDLINKMVECFLKANRRLKRWQRAVAVMAAVVVLATTYAFILPAVTLDKETASEQSGIEIAASDNEPDSSGTVL